MIQQHNNITINIGLSISVGGGGGVVTELATVSKKTPMHN